MEKKLKKVKISLELGMFSKCYGFVCFDTFQLLALHFCFLLLLIDIVIIYLFFTYSFTGKGSTPL